MNRALLLALVFLVAGCGSNTSSTTTTTKRPSTSPTPATTSSTRAATDTAPGTEAYGDGAGRLTVYSARPRALMQPLFDAFTQETGIPVDVVEGDTLELAARLAREGPASPADVFVAEDGGALGGLAKAGLLAEIPQETLNLVEPRFRSARGLWVGVSGRARSLAVSTARVTDADVPASVFDLADRRWRGRIAVTPTNLTFQSFVTAMRLTSGEERTESWLRALEENEPITSAAPVDAVAAVEDGRADVALANHWNVHDLEERKGGAVAVRNHFPGDGDPGSFVNVAGVAILNSSQAPENGARFARHLLSAPAQQRFSDVAYEYPLAAGATAAGSLPPLDSIEAPAVDLGALDSIVATQTLLRKVELLPA